MPLSNPPAASTTDANVADCAAENVSHEFCSCPIPIRLLGCGRRRLLRLLHLLRLLRLPRLPRSLGSSRPTAGARTIIASVMRSDRRKPLCEQGIMLQLVEIPASRIVPCHLPALDRTTRDVTEIAVWFSLEVAEC